MEHSEFVVKCYNKQELAQMYFPDLTIRASVNKLRRWMRKCKPLMDEILATDFHPKTKAFSVRFINDINIKRTTGDCTFDSSRSSFYISIYSLRQSKHGQAL